ncbi:glyoxal reductase [marine bacterium AO1-C]|nr:glyoxal reductase [marine bacterium AO1-C]
MNNITQIHPTIPLSNGIQMPAFGLGVLKAQDGNEVAQAVQSAIVQGYRMIDTASVYRNESGVGQGLQNASIPREELFLTTKLWNNEQGYEQTLHAFEQSLERLQTNYLDLYLIHWPVKDKYKDTWRALEQLYRDGRVRAIGVSNFQVHHLEDLLADANIRPMVNQIEMHPYLQQADLLDFAQKNHIRLEAWRPIMQGQVMQVPELQIIGAKYGKSPVQVTLRWLYQLGVIVIPKSVNPIRIGHNADIFDFELSAQDMSLIRQLDQGLRLGPDPDNFNF